MHIEGIEHGEVRGRSRVVIALNENGNRIGQSHHNSWIADVIVDLIRYGHEDYGWGYVKLAGMFGLSKNTVAQDLHLRAARSDTATLHNREGDQWL